MHVVSKEAGLKTEAPTSHNFASIAEVDKKDSVSIYYAPDNPNTSIL